MQALIESSYGTSHQKPEPKKFLNFRQVVLQNWPQEPQRVNLKVPQPKKIYDHMIPDYQIKSPEKQLPPLISRRPSD